ncbi:MAG: cardiolipin synthase ClsB [Hylemonella sp.]|uniref:cardiolipin synthase ClsB n=1 Tax=Hylemonella sp. TaxID=2066020 RepID=UPI00391CE66E
MTDRRLPLLHAGHTVHLLQGWQELFPALVAAIDRSTREVCLETYIFAGDSAGEQMVDVLVRAAQRGVAVYVVMDGVGTPELPKDWTQRLDAAGVHWHIFQPLGRLGLLIPSRWRRLHRKLCVVDGRVAFCGGINVLDDWFDPNHGTLTAPRFDFAVQVSGPLVRDVHEVMVKFWWRLQAGRKVREADWAAAWHMLEHEWQQVDALQADRTPAARPLGLRAALLLRDNLTNRTRIERAYRKAIAEAREEIIIANAYFVPGHKLRRALVLAARRGVRVRLLLQGRYEYFMQYHAVRPVYAPLLHAGVEIHEYSPSFLHAKVAVIDGCWATVGSSNLDPLSLLLAREANVVVDDAAFAAGLRTRLIRAMEHEGQRIDAQTYTRRPWRQRLLDRLAFGALRIALFLIGRRY